MSTEVLLNSINSYDQNEVSSSSVVNSSTDVTIDIRESTIELNAKFLEITPNLDTLPVRFQFKPVLSHPILIALSQHKYYYPIAFCCLIEWGGFINLLTDLPLPLFYSFLAFNALFFIIFISIELTRLDRTIFKQLLVTFEWWWLISNMLVTQTALAGRSIAHPQFDSPQQIIYLVFQIIIDFITNLYIFSLDATVFVNRKIKFCFLGFFLVGYIWTTVDNGLYRGPTTPICVHFCTTLEAIYSSSILTTTIFISKQLIHLLSKPNSFLIIKPNLGYSKVESVMSADQSLGEPIS